ncbi:MAG: adenylate/guanylate cyclase domain-containing protein [Alphaproteobacteria bacterium]|nr:adenylate/guanylate cyclase domain-containing protein [Alphaproteobacteria bacterium]
MSRALGPRNLEARQLVDVLTSDHDTSAPTPIDPSITPIDWLLGPAAIYTSRTRLIGDLGRLLVARGLPLMRFTAFLRTLHPQATGYSVIWYRDVEQPQALRILRGMEDTEAFRRSPLPLIFEGAAGIRRRLDIADENFDFPVLEDLKAEGMTDYVAMPLVFSDGLINFVTWCSDRPGGFSTDALSELWEMLPALSLRLEVMERRALTEQLMRIYLGRQTAERVLSGQIIRGRAESIRAAVWYSDLRDFTMLSDRLDRDIIIALLDAYFEAAVQAVEERGGEILKFLGDGMLAIFPADENSGAEGDEAACRAALAAARDTVTLIRALNTRRLQHDKPTIEYGIALHLGEVGYGNIGGPERLDFTVIGPAVNLVSRIEGLTRVLGVRVLASADFAETVHETLTPMGEHPVKGLSRPVTVFAPSDLL